MKVEKGLKIVFIILLIVLISLVSFGGIFIQKMKFVENIVPDYALGMDLLGARIIALNVSDATNTVIYDKDGNVVTEEGEETTKKEEPVNPEDSLTKENYQKSKEIFEKRLKEMHVPDYTIRFEEENGKVYIELPENSNTDQIAQYTTIKGVFQAVDEDKNVLLENKHIKKAQVGYSNTATGTNVYLSIQFNKEGTQILKDISNTYIKTTDEEGKETTKNITLKIDDTTLLDTYFSTEIPNGVLQLSMGQASSNSEDINQYITEASNIAVLLNTNPLPLTYTIAENRYVMSDITLDMFYIPAIVVLAVLAVGILFLIIRYQKNGFLTAISLIGYIAAYLLVIRYTNVVITLEGIAGILIAVILNYIFSVYLLHLLKNKEMKTKEEESNGFKVAFLKTLFILVPVAITSVILCFTGWLPMISFGMTIFWGILMAILYHLIITRSLIVSAASEK